MSVLPWSLLAPDSKQSDNFKVPPLSCYENRRCSIISLAPVFVGTGLHQNSDNFKVRLMSCHEKRRCSIICRALVFVGTELVHACTRRSSAYGCSRASANAGRAPVEGWDGKAGRATCQSGNQKKSHRFSSYNRSHLKSIQILELPVTAIIPHIFRFTNLLLWQVDV